MRIRIIQKPAVDCIDGIQLGHFVPGQHYDVGSQVGQLMLAEGWAEPVAPAPPQPAQPDDQVASTDTPDGDRATPKNLIREFYPPYFDGYASFAPDGRRRRKKRDRQG